MDGKIKLLIVDDNIEFLEMLTQYASSKQKIGAVECAMDGIEALKKIDEFKPDVVILDLIMPQLDGLGVLERLSRVKGCDRPSFIVLSAIGQDNHVKRAMGLGADYYIVKPFDIELLMTRVYELYDDKNSSKKDIFNTYTVPKLSSEMFESEVTRLLHRLGIPPNLSGYRFLKEAIMIILKDESYFKSVTKLLYPQVAIVCSSTSQKVERSIRNAIDCAWKNDSSEIREQLFGYIDGKPSNSQFISTLVETIKSKRI